MRKNCRKMLAALLALVLAASLCACAADPKEPSSPESGSPSSQSQTPSSQPEAQSSPETPKTAADIIMDSYYQDEPLEILPGDIALPGPVVGRVAPWYNTDTGDRESMEALLERLRNGERLSDNLTAETSLTMSGAREPWGEALVYSEDGEICGHVRVSLVTGQTLGVTDHRDATEEFSPDSWRNDFRWPELLEAVIAHGELDPDTAKLKACEFAGFATGALLYDDSREYFIPTDRQARHTVSFQTGFLYPMDELVEILSSNIDELFGYPPINTGAIG